MLLGKQRSGVEKGDERIHKINHSLAKINLTRNRRYRCRTGSFRETTEPAKRHHWGGETAPRSAATAVREPTKAPTCQPAAPMAMGPRGPRSARRDILRRPAEISRYLEISARISQDILRYRPDISRYLEILAPEGWCFAPHFSTGAARRRRRGPWCGCISSTTSPHAPTPQHLWKGFRVVERTCGKDLTLSLDVMTPLYVRRPNHGTRGFRSDRGGTSTPPLKPPSRRLPGVSTN
jgi:hypothetical protein